jgi:hypothetical protein
VAKKEIHRGKSLSKQQIAGNSLIQINSDVLDSLKVTLIPFFYIAQ